MASNILLSVSTDQINIAMPYSHLTWGYVHVAYGSRDVALLHLRSFFSESCPDQQHCGHEQVIQSPHCDSRELTLLAADLSPGSWNCDWIRTQKNPEVAGIISRTFEKPLENPSLEGFYKLG